MNLAPICIVAIARDELPFIHEWIAYHKLIGIDHFFIYDDDPALPLKQALAPHAAYVTVIDWYNNHHDLPGRNRQTKAYTHALNLIQNFQWVAMIDVDEFIVVTSEAPLAQHLNTFPKTAQSLRLTMIPFGHNGHFDNPQGLITSSLTRRKKNADTKWFKSISRITTINEIKSAHHCEHPTPLHIYMTGNININHYLCRSFQTWMKRPSRGTCVDDNVDDTKKEAELWKKNYELCLQRFVEICGEINEVECWEMLRFKQPIENFLRDINCM